MNADLSQVDIQAFKAKEAALTAANELRFYSGLRVRLKEDLQNWYGSVPEGTVGTVSSSRGAFNVSVEFDNGIPMDCFGFQLDVLGYRA